MKLTFKIIVLFLLMAGYMYSLSVSLWLACQPSNLTVILSVLLIVFSTGSFSVILKLLFKKWF